MTKEHVHTEECWEPGSGCDMGRNEKYALAVPREAVIPSKKEVEFPCGHSVAHEEDCPRCEIERLTADRDSYALHERNIAAECDRLRAELDQTKELEANHWREIERLSAALKDARRELWQGEGQRALDVINAALYSSPQQSETGALAKETPLSWFLKQSDEFKEAVYTSCIEKASEAQNAIIRRHQETSGEPGR